VWLDRGELDKLIEKATASMQASQPAPTMRVDTRHYPDPRYGHYKKPKSWLSEIFD
jgi:hypothetical protein